MKVAYAGLVAAYARADIIATSRPRLFAQLRVADHCACHATKIRLSRSDDAFGVLRLVDPARHHRCHARPRLHCMAQRRGITHLFGHRRHDVNRARNSRGRSGNNAEVVQRFISGKKFACVQHIGLLDALMAALVPGKTQAHDEILACLGANVGRDFSNEAGAVLERAAVLVAAPIDPVVQELRRKVPMRTNDLDPVESGLAHPKGRIAVGRDDFGNHLSRHRARHDVETLVRRGRSAVGNRCSTVFRSQHLATGMKQLGNQAATVTVYCLRQPAVSRNAVVGINPDRICHEHGAGMNQRNFGHDKSGAATGARLVIGDHRVADQAPFVQMGLMAGRHDSVAEREVSDVDRRKEVGKRLLAHCVQSLLALRVLVRSDCGNLDLIMRRFGDVGDGCTSQGIDDRQVPTATLDKRAAVQHSVLHVVFPGAQLEFS